MDGNGASDPIEVELTDVDSPSSASQRPPSIDRRGRGRRQALVVGALAAGVVTLAAPIVVRVLDDGTTSSTATTAPSTSASTVAVTVPATLAPLDTVASEPPLVLAPPSYPTADDRFSEPGTFDLAEALEALAEDQPRRVTTEYLAGSGGVVRRSFTLTRDVEQDRFALDLRFGSITHSFVADLAGGTTYQSINSQDLSWFGMRNDEMESSMGRELTSLIDEYLHGPIDPSWFLTQSVAAGPLVILPGGQVVREFFLTIEPDAAAERFRDPLSASDPPDVPIELRLYVTEANRLLLAEGSVHDSREWTLVVHRIEELTPTEAVVELPDRSLISGQPSG